MLRRCGPRPKEPYSNLSILGSGISSNTIVLDAAVHGQLHPGGMPACSRWSNAANTTGKQQQIIASRRVCQISRCRHPFRMRFNDLCTGDGASLITGYKLYSLRENYCPPAARNVVLSCQNWYQTRILKFSIFRLGPFGWEKRGATA